MDCLIVKENIFDREFTFPRNNTLNSLGMNSQYSTLKTLSSGIDCYDLEDYSINNDCNDIIIPLSYYYRYLRPLNQIANSSCMITFNSSMYKGPLGTPKFDKSKYLREKIMRGDFYV